MHARATRTSRAISRTATESQAIWHLEKRIAERSLEFGEAGKFLTFVLEHRIYRREFSSFSAYCRRRLNCGRAYAYQLMRAAQLVTVLAESVVDDNYSFPAATIKTFQ